MAVPAAVSDGYSRLRSAVDSVSEYVGSTLQHYAGKRDYIFRERVKPVESLAEKLETGRYNAWSELDDLYACTIVVPTADHEPDVRLFLESLFEPIALKGRDTTAKPPDVFRFDTTRYIMRLRAMPGVERPPGAESVLFEVQVPSIFQYAWAVVTRDFVYKSDVVDWRRDRLVAQLKAAVEQIETIIASFSSTAAGIAVSGYAETDLKRECATFFQGLQERGLITQQLVPSSWSRFADNVYNLVRSYGRSDPGGAMRELLQDLETDLTGPTAQRPLSGSLFQMVLAKVAAGGGTVAQRHIRRFPVIESQELRDLYGITAIPRKLTFDFTV
jgi:ppGpp synthetase/RelA/SpoT-type nucleotidyltranferase